MTLPQTILVGLLAAAIGYYFQQRAWRHKNQDDTRQREFEECLELINTLGKSIDQRLMALSTFRGLLGSGPVEKDDLERYKESVKSWMLEFSSIKSKLYHYFGRDMMLEFENSVHYKVREASDILLRTNKLGIGRLSYKDLQEHRSVGNNIDLARYIAFKFLRELNEKLENGEVGRTMQFNNVEIGNLDLISRAYLIQRLFGLKS